MSTTVGKVGWVDLTVKDAAGLKEFYTKVVGWQSEPVDMGDYVDFNLCVDGVPIGGICHARGSNAGIPAQWMMYVTVENIAQSVEAAKSAGGEIVHSVTNKKGTLTMAFVKDPAGAYFALYQSG